MCRHSDAEPYLATNYSPGGLLNYMADSDGNRTDYLYDAVGRLIGIFAPNYEYAIFRYDQGGRLTEKWLPNGVNTQYQYNADNTLKQVLNRTSTNLMITQHDYTYDGVGNRRTNTQTFGGQSALPYKYVYDELHRLTEVRNNTTSTLVESYSYDPLGNRLTKTDSWNSTVYYIYDAVNNANQLKEVRQGSASGPVVAGFVYDANGNMTTKCERGTVTRTDAACSGDIVTSLAYDALNRLVQVNKTGQPSETYAYDDQGRRISKTVGAATTNFLYNGPDIMAEYSSWTAPNAQYTHGPNTDDPIMRQAGGTTQYYHQDGLGSVIAATGGVYGFQTLDAWGNKIYLGGTIPQYGYTGREPDETGLIYYRARYYDPSIGRFTQRDPIGLRGGINRYAYVRNNPTNLVDPTGEHDAFHHTTMGYQGARQAGFGFWESVARGLGSAWVDFRSGSQGTDAATASIHFMIGKNPDGSYVDPRTALQFTASQFVAALKTGDFNKAGHSVQDFTAREHELQRWAGGLPTADHLKADITPTEQQKLDAINNTAQVYAYELMDPKSREMVNSFTFRTSTGGTLQLSSQNTQDWTYISGDGRTVISGGQQNLLTFTNLLNFGRPK